MMRTEMSDYVNVPQRQEERNKEGTNQTERRYWCFFLGFGVLCVIQACLNISLRLAFYVKEPVLWDCNATQTGGKDPVVQILCEEDAVVKCHNTQDKSNFLTAFCDLLEDRNKLKNEIKALKKETKLLKTQLKELSRCVVSEKCPPGWIAIQSRCYFLSSDTMTWDDSRAYCQRKRSDLVVINDLMEQTNIYRLNKDRNLLFWIGLRGTKGNFQWVDGSALNKSFWQAGQPDHGGPNTIEDCVEMYLLNPVSASWNDAACDRQRHWLCEKDQFKSQEIPLSDPVSFGIQ